MVGGSDSRSESEREKTKLRERQRRAITTKIFHGLRRHGAYNLSPRADINQVLRELAKEAGWHVDPDGTTYRLKLTNRCPTCGAPPNNTSTTATPRSSSTVIGAVGFGAEGSTITSPFCIDPTTGTAAMASKNSEPNTTATTSDPYMETPLAFYMYGGLNHHSNTTAMAVHGPNHHHHHHHHHHQQEAMASNHNTPVGFPIHPTN